MSWLQKFEELRLRTPRMALHNTFSVNSDYVNYGLKNKNCYMLVSAIYNEDCYFGHRILNCKDCVDNQNISRCTLCCECSDCANLYNCDGCQDCFDCSGCEYCFDCRGCEYCFGCVGLRHKKYHIYNESYSRDSYFEKLPKILDEKKYSGLLLKVPRLMSRLLNTENCTGDYMHNSKNCHNSFIIDDCEDCGYLFNCGTLKDCYDADFDDESQLNYEVLSAQNSFNLNYCYACWYSSDLNYCDMCFNCSKCFLCVGLHKKKFFILNEEYSEKDFQKKFAEVKNEMILSGEWGKFFASPYPYEDSAAAVYCG